ncbi:hypothetical protein ACQ4LE_000717 [Meloidogyne hapla]
MLKRIFGIKEKGKQLLSIDNFYQKNVWTRKNVSSRAGLQFPVGRFLLACWPRFSNWLAMLLGTTRRLASTHGTYNLPCATMRNIIIRLGFNPNLNNKLLSGVTIAQGGVLPNSLNNCCEDKNQTQTALFKATNLISEMRQ